MSEDTQRLLQDYCASAFPAWESLRVTDLVWLNAGWESDVYGFTAEYGPASARQSASLVIRSYPGDGAYGKSGREFTALRELGEAGYPVPQVYLLERERSPLGKPFVIMEKIEGQLMWPMLFHGPEQDQGRLLTLFCELFVRLHWLDWRRFVCDAARYERVTPYGFVDQVLGQFRASYDRFPRPDFLPVFEWLEARRDQVPCDRHGPVHWDFHPANILLRPDGSAVVIDWTQASISDTRFDVGWTLLLIGSHEDLSWRERVLREYERLAGSPVEQIAYFEVVAALKRLYSFAVSVSHGAETLGMRPGAEEAMKRQAGSLSRAYDMLVERTGVRVSELERLFESLGPGG
jgi:aminoglycoside phosphotransferase (APT) family kinase protein